MRRRTVSKLPKRTWLWPAAATCQTISVSAGIGSNYYNSSGIPNEAFGSQMRHNFSQSIGINLSVPLFDAFGTRNSVRRARLAGESARLRVDDTRNTLYKAICQAHSQAIAAYQKRRPQPPQLESAREAFRAVSIKYENGRANATELEKAKSDYITAMAESVRAHYESIPALTNPSFLQRRPVSPATAACGICRTRRGVVHNAQI